MTNDEFPLPIQNSYWVILDRFRAGEHPGNGSISEARNKLRWLVELGVNLIVDLTDNEMTEMNYSANITDIASILNKKVNYINIPIQDYSTPPQEKMVEILDVIDSALSQGRSIYLHCRGGMGRTGLTVGCYLTRHETQGENALEKIQELRKGIPGEHGQSPETEEQRRMVLEWNMNQ